MDDNGILNLTAVNMTDNYALAVGDAIYLGRPTVPYPEVNLLGLRFADGCWSARRAE